MERDYLISHVYPKLTEYCKKQYNVGFQVLDMRWGIASDVTNTHMATSICLNMLKKIVNFGKNENFFLQSTYYGEQFKNLKKNDFFILVN